jgi:precorrin-2 dehydrogenase/sirohydrochlorin ferrochelatase
LLQIAVSTSGASPAVARSIRQQLEAGYGPEWQEYLALLGEIRSQVLEAGELGEEARRDAFERIASADLLGRIQAGEQLDAADIIQEYACADVTPHLMRGLDECLQQKGEMAVEGSQGDAA